MTHDGIIEVSRAQEWIIVERPGEVKAVRKETDIARGPKLKHLGEQTPRHDHPGLL